MVVLFRVNRAERIFFFPSNNAKYSLVPASQMLSLAAFYFSHVMLRFELQSQPFVRIDVPLLIRSVLTVFIHRYPAVLPQLQFGTNQPLPAGLLHLLLN